MTHLNPKTRVLVTQILKASDRKEIEAKYTDIQFSFVELVAIRPLELSQKEENILRQAREIDWLIVTSESAVDLLGTKYPYLFLSENSPRNFAAVGDSTKASLLVKGVKSVFVPKVLNTGKQLAKELIAAHLLQNKLCIYARARNGRKDLIREFESHSLALTPIDLYETNTNVFMKEVLIEVLEQGIDWVTFSSPSAVKAFYELASDAGLEKNKKDFKFASIGSMTTQRAKDLGFIVHAQAIRPSIDSLLEMIEKKS